MARTRRQGLCELYTSTSVLGHFGPKKVWYGANNGQVSSHIHTNVN